MPLKQTVLKEIKRVQAVYDTAFKAGNISAMNYINRELVAAKESAAKNQDLSETLRTLKEIS